MAKPTHQKHNDPSFQQQEDSDGTFRESEQLSQANISSIENSQSDTKSIFERVDDICREFDAAWDNGRPSIADFLSKVTPEDRPVLLRNILELEVRKRRQAGESPFAREYIDQLSGEHTDLIRRVFLDTSSVSLTSAFEPIVSQIDITQRPIASRIGEYRLIRELGRGGMGSVFEAVHLGRGHRVALKMLPTVSAHALHRFKREFRAMADITHPNLVGMRTLESDGAQWFITLDLLDGCDFFSFVRPGGRLDLQRLRSALTQMATGVMALHARGIVHRDLKPGNVMVSQDGRVVILDFGLVGELSGETCSLSKIAGTPGYMAPEQAAGETVGPPADWYAVGVMVYEALCGQRPFVGEMFKVMANKQSLDAPPLPTGLDLPPDLVDLAMRLLRRKSSDRPDSLEILSVIASTINQSPATASASDQLVGRDSQLAVLAEALTVVRQDRKPMTLFVRGRSGEGKTSLVEMFLGPLRTDPTCVVLAGRCYDRESVPFKALDTIIDSLTSHLRRMEPIKAAQILPDDIGLLAHLFPVLNRCDVVAEAPRGRIDTLDQQQVRQRAFAALRLLLERVSNRTPVICFVDDLQWGDADSAAAIFEVLRPPEAPSVLFLGSYRLDEAEKSPFLKELSERQQQDGLELNFGEINVGPLSLEESTRLIASVVGRDDELIWRRAVQFHAQTGGNPFLLTELAGCFDPDADMFHATDIHGVLSRKLSDLPADAGPLLDIVAVSGQAIELGEAAAAAGLNESPEGALLRMRNTKLLRVIGDKVDTYHDRIRYAVLDRIPNEKRKTLHLKLAEVIERTSSHLTEDQINDITDGKLDSEDGASIGRVYDLSYHFDAAGATRRALAYALLAAQKARSQYANDVASQQYAIAHRNATNSPASVLYRISRGRGEALLLMGQYVESQSELSSALTLAESVFEIAEVRGLQGQLAAKLGMTADSIEHFEEAIRILGVRVPRTQIGFCISLLSQVLKKAVRSCMPRRWYRKTSTREAELANQLLARLEWSYYCNHVIKLLWASFVGLNRAEQLPPSRSLAINMVVHANDMAVLGLVRRAAKYYESAIKLSEELNDHWGIALGRSHFALGCCAAARYREALTRAEPGKEAFRKLGDMLEYHASHVWTAMALYGLGSVANSLTTARIVFESCVRYDDNYLSAWSVYHLARCSRGRLPIDELLACIQVLPGNVLSECTAAMAEGHWLAAKQRYIESLASFERAWEVCRPNSYLVTFNSATLNELVTALRLAALDCNNTSVNETSIHRRWQRMARLSLHISRFLPPERSRALREMALVYEHRGKLKKAWKLATSSVRIAESQEAEYELAQSRLVQGELAKRLGRPEGDQLILKAKEVISRTERDLNDVLNALNCGQKSLSSPSL